MRQRSNWNTHVYIVVLQGTEFLKRLLGYRNTYFKGQESGLVIPGQGGMESLECTGTGRVGWVGFGGQYDLMTRTPVLLWKRGYMV